jgi:acyl carrier protein
MTSEQIESNVRDFLSSRRGVDAAALTPSEPLFSSGLLDSLDVLELIAFLESSCGIRVSPFDVSIERFDTIGAIVALVTERRAATSARS